MAKFYGEIGFIETIETSPGIWVEEPESRNYYGDVLNNTRRLDSKAINDDITISVEISIVADPYAMNHFHNMRYVVYMGQKWKVTSVQVEQPRLKLSLGGLYHGE